MAKKLNTDGVPVDVPSVLPKKKSDIFRDLTVNPEDDYGAKLPEEPPTRLSVAGNHPVGTPPAGFSPPVEMPSSDEPKTRIAILPGNPPKPEGTASAPVTPVSPVEGTDRMSDPVVGWVVVTDGPGKGSAVQLGAGQNTLGRSEKARTRIDFGDDEISRDSHAIITYDPKHNKYYIRPGTGTNLAYVEDEPVLSPIPLTSGSDIVLGSTTIRFVALCDDSFVWS